MFQCPHPHPPAPHSFHTWRRDKLTPRIHFIKMKTQSIQWAGNWKSFSLELLRVVQSLPADSREGPGCRQPFIFQTPALPLSLQCNLTSGLSLSISLLWIHFSLLRKSNPPMESFLGYVSQSVLGGGIYIFIICLLFASSGDVLLFLWSCPPLPLNTPAVCLSCSCAPVSVSFSFFSLSRLYIPPLICLLPPSNVFRKRETA